MNARAKRLRILIIIATLFVIWCLTAPLLANYLVVEKPLAHADAIIVLSGSAAYQERTRKAAELFRQGIAGKIFVTNDGERAGWSSPGRADPRFVELEQTELIANGVPSDAIVVLPGEVSGTDQEAKQLAAELHARPIGSLLIVTSAYHTRRSLRTFEKILGEKNIDIGIEHALTGQQTPAPATWWLAPRGWQMVAAEYVKSVIYWLQY